MGTKCRGLVALLCLLGSISGEIVGQHLQTENETLIQQIDSANVLSFQYLTTNTYEAEIKLLDIVQLSDSINYKAGLAQSYKHLSLVYYYQGKYDKSAEMHLTSTRLYEELGLYKKVAQQYSGYGYQIKRHDLDRGEAYLRKGIRLSEMYQDTVSLVDSYNWYGVIKEFREDYDSALYFYEKSLELKEILRDTLGISYSLGNIGLIHIYNERYDDALTQLTQAYKISRATKDSTGMATILHNTSYIYLNQNLWKEAIAYLQRSLDLSLKLNYIDLSRANYNFISETYESAGKPDSALFYYKIFNQFNDSLQNESMQKKVAELEVQFRTEQKEKELALNRAELTQVQLKVRQRNLVLVIMGCILLCGILIMYFIYRQQKVKQLNIQRENQLRIQLANVEMENRIHQERERISRDLHDNVGSQITNLITGIEISNLHIKRNQKDEALGLLSNLDTNAREAMTDLRETIWLLDKNEVRFKDFMKHLNEYLKRQQPYLGALKMNIKNDVQREIQLNPTQSLHLLRIIQEALNNCRKYAGAFTFNLHFYADENHLILNCSDDGCGAAITEIKNTGNGLRNIERRLTEISGQLIVKTEEGEGFSLHIKFPYRSSKSKTKEVEFSEEEAEPIELDG